jgi:hypothetical protein
MEVGVAVLALIGSIGKFQVGMTIAACDGGVSSSERKAGPGVVELDFVLDYLPVGRGVASGTRQFDLAVRALGVCPRPHGFGVHDACAHPKEHRSNE